MSLSEDFDSDEVKGDKSGQTRKTRRQNMINSDETDSESDDDVEESIVNKNKKVAKLSESDTSDLESDIKIHDVEFISNDEEESDESWTDESTNNDDESDSYEESMTSSEEIEVETNQTNYSEPSTSSVNTYTPSKATTSKGAINNVSFDYISSDSGDEDTEKCAICLRCIKQQEVATPEGCDHIFCSVCLLEWSKNNNKCPLDRQQFKLILIRENKNGKDVRQVTIEEPAPNLTYEDNQDDDDATFCEICGLSDREDRMLLCDGCDMGFHLECLTPPLDAIPSEDEWYCPDCLPNNPNMAEAVEMYEGELYDLLDDPNVGPLPVRSARYRRYRHRVIRTRQFERLRNVIVNNLWSLQASRDNEEISSSESENADEEEEEEDIYGPSTSSAARGAPSTSTTQSRVRKTRKTTTTTRKSKTGTKRKKSAPKRTTKRRKTTKTKTTTRGRKKKTVQRRKTWRTKTKTIQITNDDGTVTEEVVAERIYKKKIVRRRKKGKRKIKKTSSRRGSSRLIRPKTTKERLVRQLGMLPMKPGQLLPSVKIKPNGLVSTSSRSALPTLRIFEPSVDDRTFASESESEDVGEDGSGGVSTLSRARTVNRTASHVARRKAALLLRQVSTQRSARPKIVAPSVGESENSYDVLGSILKGQEECHSRHPNKILPEEKKPDVNSTPADVANTHAPVFPGQSGLRQQYHGPHPEATTTSTGANTGGGNMRSSGVGGGSRFGHLPSRNDREGYTNYFNNSSPTPYCRGGPPVWFRMQMRPPLVRRGLPPLRSNRHQPWQHQQQNQEEPETIHRVTPPPRRAADDEDVDIYSDIEGNVDKAESSEGGEEYPALGPPPEPPAFLLCMGQDDEDEDKDGEKKDKSDVYDPAEPCDSDEEDMVIDEAAQQQQQQQQLQGEVAGEAQQEKEQGLAEEEQEPEVEKSTATKSEEQTSLPNLDLADDNSCCGDEEIYSTSTIEFSKMAEEEREKELKEVEMRQQQQQQQHHQQEEAEKKMSSRRSEEERSVARLSFDMFAEKSPSSQELDVNRTDDEDNERPSREDELVTRGSEVDKSSSVERKSSGSSSRSTSPDVSDSDEMELHNQEKVLSEDEDKENKLEELEDWESVEKEVESTVPKVAPGLEGLDVEQVSSENEGVEFSDKSLSLSDLSPQRKQFRSPVSKKKKKKRRRKSRSGKGIEEGEIDSEEKRSSDVAQKNDDDEVNENVHKDKLGGKRRGRSVSGDRTILTSRENKKMGKKSEKESDVSWKKPSRKEKNYRETKKFRGRSRSKEKRKSRSRSKEKKKSKDRKKKLEKKKDIERYDVRKIVKNKEVRKTDEFGRDLVTKSRSRSRSLSRSRTRSPRGRSRNRLRRASRSPSRGFRRVARSPLRRRNIRTRSRSFSLSRSRSPRKLKKKKKDRSRSRSRSRSASRGAVRRRSVTRSPVRRLKKNKRRSWSRSPSYSPHRSPLRVARRSLSRSWSRSPLPVSSAPPPLEKLTVVLTTKDKKKNKRKKENKKSRKEDETRKKRTAGNSKEVFASGDNILVSVNFKNNRSAEHEHEHEHDTNVISEQTPAATSASSRRKRSLDYQVDHLTGKQKKKKNCKTHPDTPGHTNSSSKRVKKLTRLSERDAQVILNRKPVAVIDLDISPYREQTPSPVNVVVVSDSGSGDEGKDVTMLPDKNQDGVTELTSGPKTPPEPHVKFSISKPQQLRPIINPLGEEEEEEEEDEEEEEEEEVGRLNLDRRIEKELEGGDMGGAGHKGPNTPPEPRPTTPSPDVYDPFEPTKSRSPSPERLLNDEIGMEPTKQDSSPNLADPSHHTSPNVTSSEVTENKSVTRDEAVVVVVEDEVEELEEEEVVVVVENGEASPKNNSNNNNNNNIVTELTVNKLPVLLTKQTPLSVTTTSAVTTGQTVTSPAKSSGIQRLQHRLGSPVNRTSLAVSEILSSGNYLIRNATKQNGQTRVTEPSVGESVVDMVVDMDDSPYSPASSEGDDLFDPPSEPHAPPLQQQQQPQQSQPVPVFKPTPKNQHKSPAKQTVNKFDLLFGPSLSPLKVSKKKTPNMRSKFNIKPAPKKGQNKKNLSSMKTTDEDQLKILDDLPSSAVELQVKDKFLKKLNRQERVIDEVKTVLKPHYAKRHVTKEEYKEILRKSVPKICHSRSGEINPSKIQQLIEAYVKKYRYAKKKMHNTVAKPKTKKTMFS